MNDYTIKYNELNAEEFPFEDGERMCDEFAEIMFNDILSAEHKLTLIKQIKK